jgi:hypothetical protein
MNLSRSSARTSVLLLLLSLRLAAADEPGFQSLFDGRTFDGWESPDMSYWSIEDGAITGKITKEHPCTVNQYLVWKGGELADFELRLKSRLSGEGGINNGFQFRSRLLPDHDIAGYQMDNNLKTDWLVRLYDEFGRHTLAWRGQRTVFDVSGKATHEEGTDAKGPAWFKLEDWHEYDLICEGPHLTLKVNGRLAAEVIDNDVRRQDFSGVLGLQLHSGPPTIVQFKDIRLRVIKPGPKAGRARAEMNPARTRILEQAEGWWDLGAGGHGAKKPLAYRGSLEQSQLDVLADGSGAIPRARVAEMSGGYFDAGKDLNLSGHAITVYLRARDPKGSWQHALLAKRGGHDTVNFNLFSTNLEGTPGPDIGFEVHSANGFAMVSFPVSKIDATAWHDLAGRYNGEVIEIVCDGRVMARKPWKGGDLTLNQEPLLIGAETDAGKVVRPFHGDLEEAAVWSRALSDAELAAVMRVKGVEAE